MARLHDFGIFIHSPYTNPFQLSSLLFYDKIVPPYFLITSALGHIRIYRFSSKTISYKTYRGKSNQNLDFKISYEVQNRANSEFVIVNHLSRFHVLHFIEKGNSPICYAILF